MKTLLDFKNIRLITFVAISISTLMLTSCAVNPVTGRNQLSFYPESWDLQTGAEQYSPSQQSQGGAYSVDQNLTTYVNGVGQRLAAVSDSPLPYEFVVLNNSVPNAWALPGGKIAVNRGLLLELNNEAELAAVLGHEVVHAAARHGAQSMTRGSLLQGALAVGTIASNNNEYADYVVGASQLGAQLVSTRYGREAERESDYYGIQYMILAGYDPAAAITLQETFVRLSEGRSGGWVDGLFASHPASQERVENNRARVAELQTEIDRRNLELGEARYQAAIAYLKQTEPAYELFDEAERAVAENDFNNAKANLREAIEMVPGEARFSGLRADIYVYEEQFQQAITEYNEAIQKDPNYYDYYLGRGVAHSRQGARNLAKNDLERSAELLPTAIAMNELGKLSLSSNDRASAKQYFQMAASAQGAVGQDASSAFTRLDVEDNPASYVQAQVFADERGRIFARVTNRSPLTLRNILVGFSAAMANGVRQNSGAINSIAAGAYVDVNSGLAFPQGAAWTQDQMRAVINSAQL